MDNAFRSFADLKQAHDALARRRWEADTPDSSARSAAILAFIDAATGAGAYLAREDQRNSAQDILEFWMIELISGGDPGLSELKAPLLAEYQPVSAETAPETAPESGAEADVPPVSGARPAFKVQAAFAPKSKAAPEAQSRSVIRVVGLSREWQARGELDGYLLKGAALEEAQALRHIDHDIAKLVAASEAEEERSAKARTERKKRAKNLLIATLCVVIAVLSVAALKTYWAGEAALEARDDALRAKDAAEVAKAAAEGAKAAADAEAQLSEQLRRQAERLTELAAQEAETLNDRLADLTNRQQSLDTLMSVLRIQVEVGNISPSDLPADIAQALEAQATLSQPDEGSVSDAGYDPAFLGPSLALPTLTAANADAAVQGGDPVDYLNYSVVMHGGRRLAIFAAANLDRRQRRVLPQLPEGYLPEPRLDPLEQPEPEWFFRGDLWPGALVSGREIAWGPEMAGDDLQAARRLANAVSVFPNLVPQFRLFNQGVWADIDQWVLTEHNPTAARVSVFTGPVLAATDPMVLGVRMPRGFWKVAVSVVPPEAKGQAPASPRLRVDAFLVLQFREGSDLPAFDHVVKDRGLVLRYRVPLSRIERLAGVRFDPAIQAADPSAAPPEDPAAEDGLIRAVPGLDGPSAVQRIALANEMIAALRDPGYGDRLALVAALLDMADDSSMRGLSATGRLNLLLVLSQVPRANWEQKEFAGLRDRALAAIAALDRRVRDGQTRIGTDTKGHLDRLRANLGVDRPPQQTVLFQFAGMTRETAVDLSQTLAAFGWKIPGEERTGKAAGINEIRFNPALPADRLSAARLVADLRAAGHTALTGAVENGLIKPGTLEIWISR